MKCRQLILDGDGLFCTNYSSKRNHWKSCLQVWCRPCYIPIDNHDFPSALPVNEEGIVNEEDKISKRYCEARNGDNFSAPFQCNTCYFRNLMGRDHQTSLSQDLRILKCIRRVNLDALWSLEPRNQ